MSEERLIASITSGEVQSLIEQVLEGRIRDGWTHRELASDIIGRVCTHARSRNVTVVFPQVAL